jgi:hypothetical protein
MAVKKHIPMRPCGLESSASRDTDPWIPRLTGRFGIVCRGQINLTTCSCSASGSIDEPWILGLHDSWDKRTSGDARAKPIQLAVDRVS